MATVETAKRKPNSPVRDETVSQSLARLDALARIMDSAITLPGSNVSIGFDAALGLVPVIGDVISTAIGSYIIWEAKRLGAPKFLLARMSANTAIDTVIGSIPLLGDVFDVAYKSNRRNVALLTAHIEKHGVSGAGTIEGEYRRT